MKIPRALALEILDRINSQDTYPDILLDRIFKREPHLTRLDRAFITELVYGVLRWQGRIDWIIGQFSKFKPKRINPFLLNILRLGTYQSLFLTKVPDSAAVNESVKLAKLSQSSQTVSFVNGVLRAIVRGKDNIVFPHAEMSPLRYISVFYSHPQWMVKKWLHEIGEDGTISLCEANNQIPPFTIRTNILKISRDDLMENLSKDISSVFTTKFSPDGLFLKHIPLPVTEMEAYKNGWFYVQDEASQLIARILNPEPHERILDACSGLGGKTTHLAQLMEDRGEIWAWDNNTLKLSILEQTISRLGIRAVKVKTRDVLAPFKKSGEETYHRILIDAPCTGLGTIRRNPDIKWKKGPEDCIRLQSLQVRILKNLAPLLKENAVMVYSTCTIAKEENEEVIESFLRDFPNFVVEDILPVLGDTCKDLISPSGFFKTYPHRHNMDGFFAARLRKLN